MDYKNKTIVVTIDLEPRLASRGGYQSQQKADDKGNKVFEVWRNPLDNSIERIPAIQLKTVQLPKFHNCQEHTTLNESFYNWACSDDAKPKDVSAGYWNRMNEKNRIHFHVRKYVQEMFGDSKFSYTILE